MASQAGTARATLPAPAGDMTFDPCRRVAQSLECKVETTSGPLAHG
jgi:hypothetical protein